MLPSPRKLPKQSRSKLMFESIKQACHKILKEDGASALNTNKIAEVTGVSVGSLYQYFENVDAILAALFSDLAAGMASSTSAYINRELKTLSVEDKFVFIVDRNIEFHKTLIRLHAEFYRRYRRYFDFEAEISKIDASFAGFSSVLADSNVKNRTWQGPCAISPRASKMALDFVHSSLVGLIESAPEELFRRDIALSISVVALSVVEIESKRLYKTPPRQVLLNEIDKIWCSSRERYRGEIVTSL